MNFYWVWELNRKTELQKHKKVLNNFYNNYFLTVMQNKKPGKCPKPVGPGECFELCSGDNDCPGKFKCCSDGCGRLCMSPGIS